MRNIGGYMVIGATGFSGADYPVDWTLRLDKSILTIV
jgi:hypothetical protein